MQVPKYDTDQNMTLTLLKIVPKTPGKLNLLSWKTPGKLLEFSFNVSV